MSNDNLKHSVRIFSPCSSRDKKKENLFVFGFNPVVTKVPVSEHKQRFTVDLYVGEKLEKETFVFSGDSSIFRLLSKNKSFTFRQVKDCLGTYEIVINAKAKWLTRDSSEGLHSLLKAGFKTD